MTRRERVLKTFRFEQTHRPPCDLMEGFIWPELAEFYKRTYGTDNNEAIFDLLDTDFRWLYVTGSNDDEIAKQYRLRYSTYSDHTCDRPLAGAHTAGGLIARYPLKYDPARIIQPDYAAARWRWPDHALVLLSRIPSLFMSACEDFGMEECLVKMMIEPEVLDAYLQILHAYCMDMIHDILSGAKGHCDICWLMDDVASQESLIMHPDQWRRFFKPRLAEQVQRIKEYGLLTLFHSCGAIREIIPDLIEIGINGLLVFQTTARNMEPESVAREHGGKIVFYGGMDVQNLLRLGSREDVKAAVQRNVRAFAPYGGYVVANSHHCIGDIRGENIIAMCEEAHFAADTQRHGNPI